MSTNVYLVCLDHDPPLLAADESGQHLYDLPQIRADIAGRVALVEAYRTSDSDFGYFRTSTVRFLAAHQTCRIGIEDEYGRQHPTEQNCMTTSHGSGGTFTSEVVPPATDQDRTVLTGRSAPRGAQIATQRVVVLVNRNVTMTPGKLAAQAVHAALMAFGVEHGSVVVLNASRNKVEAEPFTVRDAGLTELEPGTLTCGAHLVGGDSE